jgi:hypothetical protein
MQTSSQHFLFRFVLQIWSEIRAVTKPEKVFAVLVVLAGMLYQSIRGGISVDLKNTGIAGAFSVLWAVCIFGSWLAFKAGRVLHLEDIKAFEAYKPALHYVGDPPKRKRPSAWLAYMTPTVMSSLLLTVAFLSFTYVPTMLRHRYFPWLPLNGVSLALDGQAAGVVMSFAVRDESPNRPGGSSVSLPNNPLDNVRLLITTPIPRSDAEGWHECQLARAGFAEWSNRDTPPNAPVFGWMRLEKPAVLLHATASASNGTWDAIVVILVVNGRPEIRELVTGRFFSDDSTLTIDEASAGFPAEERRIPLRWDNLLFAHYRVSSVALDKVAAACQSIQAQFH